MHSIFVIVNPEGKILVNTIRIQKWLCIRSFCDNERAYYGRMYQKLANQNCDITNKNLWKLFQNEGWVCKNMVAFILTEFSYNRNKKILDEIDNYSNRFHSISRKKLNTIKKLSGSEYKMLKKSTDEGNYI